MARVHVSNVVVMNNPCPFFTPFKFEITFECLESLKEGTDIIFLWIMHLPNKNLHEWLYSIVIDCDLILSLFV